MRSSFLFVTATVAALCVFGDAPGLGASGTAAISFIGDWTGSLTYRDFASGRAVALPTSLAVTSDGQSFNFAYVYQESPGRVTRDEERVWMDPVAGTLRISGRQGDEVLHGSGLATFAEGAKTEVVLTGTGTDNALAVDVRETVDLDATAFVMHREVRIAGSAFFTRSVYRFTRVLPPSAFLADAAILRRAYEALHPGLYRYNTPRVIDDHYKELSAALARAKSIPQVFLAFTQFTATLRCGHSYPNFFNQPEALARAMFGGTNRVPFYFVWRDRHMIVTKNFSDDPALAPGTDVLAVDGYPAAEILDRLLTFARADGSNDAKRIDQLQVTGRDKYEAFDVYYPLAFPTITTNFDLRVRPLGSAVERAIRVKAESDEQRYAPIAQRNAAINGGSAPLWTVRNLNPEVAYLKMPTWQTYNSKWDWKRSIDDVFARLSADRTPNLIVDLRGNEGGTDVGNEIVAHLIDAPIPMDAVRRLVRYRAVPPDLTPYLDTWDPSFKDWGAAAVPFDRRFFRLTKYDDNASGITIAPQPPKFAGRVWVLVDASNSSATFQFADLVQRQHLATLVGMPTGGNQRGINGGAFFFVRLPNSGIEVDLPLIGTFPIAEQPDAGLHPDVYADRTPADIARGTDAALNAILVRIGSPQSRRP